MLFVQVILPVFLITAAGFVFARKSGADLQSLANSVLYLFAPSLVFSALIKSHVESDLLGRLALFMALYTALLCLLAFCVSRWCKFDSDTTRAFTLTTSMVNIGNFGPVCSLQYSVGHPGDPDRSRSGRQMADSHQQHPENTDLLWCRSCDPMQSVQLAATGIHLAHHRPVGTGHHTPYAGTARDATFTRKDS